MKTIYNTAIPITSQEQADRLREVCINEGLAISENKSAFSFNDEYNVFGFAGITFFVLFDNENMKHTLVTEAEWMKLLKTTK